MPTDRSIWLPKAADRFKTIRTISNKTITELAKEAGVSIRTVSDLEHGVRMPSVAICMRLGDALGVPNLATRLLED